MALTRLCASLFAFIMLTLPVRAFDDHPVDVKLFGNDVIGDYNGCHFAFWQENKDPAQDKYPYIFYAPIHDAVALPGWVQIGKKVHEMERLDQSSDSGLPDKYQLYRSLDNKISLIMEIKEQSRNGDFIEIGSAQITLVQPDTFPFKSRNLNGQLGCPPSVYGTVEDGTSAETSALDGDAISLYSTKNHDSFNAVPAPIINYVRNELVDCDLGNVPEYAVSYQISDAMSLWELPCALFARNASSVFFTALNSNPDFFVALTAAAPPGLGKIDRFDIINPGVDLKTATISSYNVSIGEDCGTYEVHQLRAVEGEAIELQLKEYREKVDCDGVAMPVENFPLVYSSR